MTLLAALLMAAAGGPRNLDQALDAQRSLVEQRPGDVQVLNDLGNLLALAGELDEARQTYRKALELQPDDVTTRYNLALVLDELGEPKQAVRELEQVVQIDPGHAWAHYQLGTHHAKAGRRARAIHHYTRAFALDYSLTSPKVNPQVVENELVTEALLRAYVTEPRSTQAPRIYRQPGSVAHLLLPPEQEPVSEQQPAAAEPMGHRARFWAEEEDEASEDDDGAPAEREAGSRPRRLDEASLPNQSGGARSSSALVPSTSPEATPRRGGEASKAPSPGSSPRGVTTEPSGVTPFVPALPSTGRLDLELVPASTLGASALAS